MIVIILKGEMLKRIFQESYRTAFWLVVWSFALTVVYYPPVSGKINTFFKLGIFTSALWVLLWLGNAYASEWVSGRISWTAMPVKRFLVGMLVMILYTVSVVLVLLWFFRLVLNFDLTNDFTGIIYGSLGVTVVISLFMHSLGFLQNWKEAAIDAERLQKESVRAQYEALKNQVNPHFLFNSLNALTQLVYKDQDKAAAFIKQLSKVYRYVLDTNDRELVTLEEEAKFLESYLFLQQIRFGGKLRVEVNLSIIKTQLPAMALQMLVENAIKHNVIAEEQPLTIRVYTKDEFLVVSNDLQKKQIPVTEESGVGLINIRRRYEFLTDRKVEVTETEKEFMVKLPFLSATS